MITKERLLAGLEEAIHVEEGLATFYTNYAKALTRETESLPPDVRKEIESLLTVLYRDSARHRDTVEALMLKIEKEDKNEY